MASPESTSMRKMHPSILRPGWSGSPCGATRAELTSTMCCATTARHWFGGTNLGDIEKHVLLARAPEVNRPTSIVFDLDPGEPAGILECGEIALHLKKMLKEL